MTYVIVKAAHIVCLFVWISGMVAVALCLRFPVLAFMEKLKAYDRAVTTPAMVLALCLGLFLAIQGGWFWQSWLVLKILLVLVLSGIHGALTGRLRRAVNAAAESEAGGHWFLPAGLALVTLIVLLVTLKP